MNNQHTLKTWKNYYTYFFVLLIMGVALVIFWNSIGNGINRFESNFWPKNYLLESIAHLRLNLGDRVFTQALIGPDQWLNLTNYNNLDDYQNTVPLSSREIKDILKKTQILSTRLNARNITLVIAVAPNKATIYPEKVPPEIQQIEQKSRLDNLLEAAQKSGSSVFIDLRPGLIEARQHQQVYYRIDTHWNAIGAFFAYQDIIKFLALSRNDLKIPTINDYVLRKKPPVSFGLANLVGPNFATETLAYLEPKGATGLQEFSITPPNRTYTSVYLSWIPNKQGLKLLMINDSFGGFFRTYLPEQFSQTISFRYTDLGNYESLFRNKMQGDLTPDVVLIEVVERSIGDLNAILEKLLDLT